MLSHEFFAAVDGGPVQPRNICDNCQVTEWHPVGEHRLSLDPPMLRSAVADHDRRMLL